MVQIVFEQLSELNTSLSNLTVSSKYTTG